jgi:hypothetical protein
VAEPGSAEGGLTANKYGCSSAGGFIAVPRPLFPLKALDPLAGRARLPRVVACA